MPAPCGARSLYAILFLLDEHVRDLSDIPCPHDYDDVGLESLRFCRDGNKVGK